MKKVTIRGTGLLACRLLLALARSQDIKVNSAIAKEDPTLTRLLNSWTYGGELTRRSFPKHFFIDGKSSVVKGLADQYPHLNFSPLEELSLEKQCDALIDTAPMGSNKMDQEYRNFSGPIICQDGVYPWGHLIAPPLTTVSIKEKRFRQGGCIISGLTPVFSELRDIIKRVRITIVMQDDSRGDYFIAERTNTFRFLDSERINTELSQLFEAEIVVENLVQIPGILNYAILPVIECHKGVTATLLEERLSKLPRVRLIPKGVSGTHDLNLIRSTDQSSIPPIAVFAESFKLHDTSESTIVKMTIGLHYPMLAVLPNVDAARMLLYGTEPFAAMMQTDEDMGF